MNLATLPFASSLRERRFARAALLGLLALGASASACGDDEPDASSSAAGSGSSGVASGATSGGASGAAASASSSGPGGGGGASAGGCERFRYRASGGTCENSCALVPCTCMGADFPFAACTDDGGCIVGIDCETHCTATLEETLDCKNTYTVPFDAVFARHIVASDTKLGSESAGPLAFTPQGELYVAGGFRGDTDFGGQTLPSESELDGTSYLAKYAQDGALISATSAHKVSIRWMGVDAEGTLGVVGSGSGNSTLGGASPTGIFWLRLDPSLNLKDVHELGDSAALEAAPMPDGGIALVRSFTAAMTFAGKALTPSGGKADIAIARVKPDGSVAWVKQFGGPGTDQVYGVAATADGVAVVGSIDAPIAFGGSTLTPAGGSDGFVVVLDASGAPSWSKLVGSATGYDQLTSVTTSAEGNVIVAGSVTGIADAGGGALPFAGGGDAVVAAYSPAGAHLWSETFGGEGLDAASVVRRSPAGVLVQGNYAGEIPFGAERLNGSGSNNAFLAELGAEGAVTRVTGLAADASLGAIAVSSAGAIAMGGKFREVIDVGRGRMVAEKTPDGVFVVFAK